MTMTDEELDAAMDAAAALMALSIAPEQRAGVRFFLGVAAEMAARLDAAALDEDELALAPVYRPPSADHEATP